MVRIPIHPGKFLAEELEALGISANQLAKDLGCRRTDSRRLSGAGGASPEIRRCAWGVGMERGRTFG